MDEKKTRTPITLKEWEQKHETCLKSSDESSHKLENLIGQEEVVQDEP
jgi:hypothetical protein